MRSIPHLPSPRGALVGAVVVLSATGLAACGSSKTSSTSTAAATKPAAATTTAFTSCMTSHGVPASALTAFTSGHGPGGGARPVGATGGAGPEGGGTPPSGSGSMPTGTPPSAGAEGGMTGTPPSGAHAGGAMTAPEGVSVSVWTNALAACRSDLPTRSTQAAG